MRLCIGNKNYSSWSMRPWVLMKQAGIAFEEVKLRFDAFTPQSAFKTMLATYSPAGKVPVLIDDDGFAVWDTLAIAEYLAERFPGNSLWPADARSRARARSVCAEMHAGFGALRDLLPMNIEARMPEVGRRMLSEHPALRDDVVRIEEIWHELLDVHGGPMLFGTFGIADAFFAPVAMRFETYGVPLSTAASGYVQRLQALPGVAAWVADALSEHDFLDFEEPYRAHP